MKARTVVGRGEKSPLRDPTGPELRPGREKRKKKCEDISWDERKMLIIPRVCSRPEVCGDQPGTFVDRIILLLIVQTKGVGRVRELNGTHTGFKRFVLLALRSYPPSYCEKLKSATYKNFNYFIPYKYSLVL